MLSVAFKLCARRRVRRHQPCSMAQISEPCNVGNAALRVCPEATSSLIRATSTAPGIALERLTLYTPNQDICICQVLDSAGHAAAHAWNALHHRSPHASIKTAALGPVSSSPASTRPS